MNEKKLGCGCVITSPESGQPQRSWCAPCAIIAAGQSLEEVAKFAFQSAKLLQVAGGAMRKASEEFFENLQLDNCPHGNNPLLCPDCE